MARATTQSGGGGTPAGVGRAANRSMPVLRLGSNMVANVQAPPPSQPPQYIPPEQSFGVGGGGNAGAMSAMAAPAPAMTDAEYLSGDSQYQLQMAALAKALGDQSIDNTAQQTRYNTDYSGAVKNLGWMQDDPTTPQDEGAWSFQDQNTASGRAFQNQQNDYAGRGMLQSSAYTDANRNLTRSLNDQLGATNTAKDSFLADLARQQSTFASDNMNQGKQAQIEALTRRASGVSLA